MQFLQSGLKWFKFSNLVAPVAALIGIASFVGVAIFGLGKDPSSWMTDFYWYYAGGECFETGSHMYDKDCVSPILERLHWDQTLAGLSYPPHFAPITYLTSLLPLNISAWIFFGLCMLAALALLFIMGSTERRTRAADTGLPISHLWMVLIVLGASGLWGAAWLGQVSLLLAPMYWIVFRNLKLQQPLVAGILLSLISVKPQLAFLPFFWILLNGRFATLGIAGACALLLSMFAFVAIGPVESVRGWIESVSTYQNYPVNALGSASLMGIPSALAVVGVNAPIWLATLVGAAALILLRHRNKLDPFSPMALATILSLQMVIFSRPVDTPVLAPALALLWPTDKSKPAHYLLFFSAAALLCFPQQIVTKVIPFEIAAHFRTSLLIVFVAIFFRLSWLGKTRFTGFDDLSLRTRN